jgi:hypothetical protein
LVGMETLGTGMKTLQSEVLQWAGYQMPSVTWADYHAKHD